MWRGPHTGEGEKEIKAAHQQSSGPPSGKGDGSLLGRKTNCTSKFPPQCVASEFGGLAPIEF